MLDHTNCPTCWDDLNQDRLPQSNAGGRHNAANIVQRSPLVPLRNENIGLSNRGDPNSGQPIRLQNSTVTVHNTMIQVVAPQAHAGGQAAPPSRVPPSRAVGEITIEARRMKQVMRTQVNSIGGNSGIFSRFGYADAVREVCGGWEEWQFRRDGLEMLRRDFLNMLEDEMYSVLEGSGFVDFDMSGKPPEDLDNFLRSVAKAMCGG